MDDEQDRQDRRDAMILKSMSTVLRNARAINSDTSGYYEVEKSQDEKLREEYPSLKDAWEKYQSVLVICKHAHENK